MFLCQFGWAKVRGAWARICRWEATITCPSCEHMVCHTHYDTWQGVCKECAAVLESIPEVKM